MNKFLMLAGVFLLCAAMNLLNVFQTGNGFSLILGLVWLAASFVCFMKHQKSKKNDSEEDKA